MIKLNLPWIVSVSSDIVVVGTPRWPVTISIWSYSLEKKEEKNSSKHWEYGKAFAIVLMTTKLAHYAENYYQRYFSCLLV